MLMDDWEIALRPTPVQRMEGLQEALGTDALLIVKRDDLTGLALGGNKARKLAALAVDAIAQGADCLVTGGGRQSNHARITAAAARRIDLDCHLVLGGGPTDDRDGNLLLDELLGAHLHFDPASDYYGIEAAITALADRLRADGHSPYTIPVGGASAMGCAAYITAVEELREQFGADPTWMVVADGSGGTHAGLLAGLGHASATRVLGVDVGHASRPRGRRPGDGARRRGAARLGAAEPEGARRPRARRRGLRRAVRRVPGGDPPRRAHRGPAARPGVLGEGDGRAADRAA